jgi:hypothetical protein
MHNLNVNRYLYMKTSVDTTEVEDKVPRHAVCCVVLNLPKQDGTTRSQFALAEAYRIFPVSSGPFWWVLAQNR